jgi:glutamyl-tRNA reductase
LTWIKPAGRVAPILRAMRSNTEQALRGELERAARLLQRGVEPAEVVEALSRRLTNKLLHAPLRALRLAGAPPEKPGMK